MSCFCFGHSKTHISPCGKPENRHQYVPPFPKNLFPRKLSFCQRKCSLKALSAGRHVFPVFSSHPSTRPEECSEYTWSSSQTLSSTSSRTSLYVSKLGFVSYKETVLEQAVVEERHSDLHISQSKHIRPWSHVMNPSTFSDANNQRKDADNRSTRRKVLQSFFKISRSCTTLIQARESHPSDSSDQPPRLTRIYRSGSASSDDTVASISLPHGMVARAPQFLTGRAGRTGRSSRQPA